MNKILETVLIMIIQILLPVTLGYVVIWINAKIKEVKAKMSTEELNTTITIINQLVLAAEQSGPD